MNLDLNDFDPEDRLLLMAAYQAGLRVAVVGIAPGSPTVLSVGYDMDYLRKHGCRKVHLDNIGGLA